MNEPQKLRCNNLGVNFLASRKLTIDTIPIKRKFFVACNCSLGKAKCLDDMIKLSLMESYCLPILTYATVAMKLSPVQISDLNACWNSVYRRIFGFNKWESVRVFINGIGRLDFCHLKDYLRLKFISSGIMSLNVPFAYAIIQFFHSNTFTQFCHDIGIRLSSVQRFSVLPCGVFKRAIHVAFEASCVI